VTVLRHASAPLRRTMTLCEPGGTMSFIGLLPAGAPSSTTLRPGGLVTMLSVASVAVPPSGSSEACSRWTWPAARSIWDSETL